MENKEMVEYKESFITKVKGFFKNVFSKEKNVKPKASLYIQETDNKQYGQFQEGLKVEEYNNPNGRRIDTYEKQRNQFLEEINGNVEMLNNLSVDRLMRLEDYYNSVIEENKKIISKKNL